MAYCRTRTRCGTDDGVLPEVKVEGDREIVGHPTTSALMRSGPSESILLTDEPWFTHQLCLIYGAAWRGLLPTNLGAPDQSVAGDGLSPRDQVLEIKNSNILPLDLQGSKLNSKLKKTKFNINSLIDQCIEHATS
jgi:hypothetical protein